MLSVVAHITAIENISPSLYANAWIIYQFLCYVVALVPFVVIYIILKTLHRDTWRKIYVGLLKVLLVIMVIVLVYPLTIECVKVTDKKPISYDDYNTEGYYMDGFKDTGYFIKGNLPANSAILLETSVEYDRHYLMFYADRSTYQFVTGSNSATAPDNDPSTISIKDNGGIPYLVSVKDYNYLCLYKSPFKPYYRIYDLK